MDLEKLSEVASVFGAELDNLIYEIKSEEREKKRLLREIQDIEEAQQVLQDVAQAIEQEAHARIASIVTRCFESIFPDPYEFRLVFEKKRGRTEARPVFLKDGEEIDPKDGAGGGVLNVAAFALRLARLILTRPKPRQILFLDEPFGAVSKEYRPAVRELVEQLSVEMGVQIVIVTHDQDNFTIGKVIELK